MTAPVTDADRIAVVREVTRMLVDGRVPGPAEVTDGARTLGSFFGAHNETLGEPVADRWAQLLDLGPAVRVVPRSVHAVSGERVMAVVAAVRPGSAAMAAALFTFQGRRIAQIECFADAARAFEHVGMTMPRSGPEPD